MKVNYYLDHTILQSLSLMCCVDFQNNLRTQAGNTTTVNIVVHTVDYLLRLQVKIYRNLIV